MDESGSSFETIRLVIACVVAGMGAASMAKPHQTDEEKKALGWVFVVVAIVAYIFIKVLITIAALLAFLFLTWKLGPLVLQWAHGAKEDLSREISVWNGQQFSQRRPTISPNRFLEEIEEALEEGIPADEIREHIRRRRNGDSDRNGQ